MYDYAIDIFRLGIHEYDNHTVQFHTFLLSMKKNRRYTCYCEASHRVIAGSQFCNISFKRWKNSPLSIYLWPILVKIHNLMLLSNKCDASNVLMQIFLILSFNMVNSHTLPFRIQFNRCSLLFLTQSKESAIKYAEFLPQLTVRIQHCDL